MPYHVQVFLYRPDADGTIRYAFFERSDYAGAWQGVCGGGEEGESIVQTAVRESCEEAGLTDPGPVYHLNSISWMRPMYYERFITVWGKELVVMPMYYFGMPFSGDIVLSDEHTQYRWATADECLELTYFNEQKTAIWELEQRILRGEVEREPPAWMQVEHNIESYIKFLGS